MMNVLLTLFGQGDSLTPLQMGLRAFTLYLFALILVRISGRRTFGKKTTYDNVVAILLGAVLSRAVVGASPYWSTVAAGLVLVCLHRLIAWLSLRYPKFGELVKGKEVLLYSKGEFHHQNMKRCLVAEADLIESIRLNANANSYDQILEIFMERSGKISIIQAKDRPIRVSKAI